MSSFLTEIGCIQSKVDPCLFWLPRVDDAEAGWYEDEDGVPHEVDDDDDDDHEEDDREVYGGYVASHVDDVRGRSSDKTFEWLSYELQSRFKMGLLRQVLPTTERGGSKTSDEVDFLGERWTEFPDCVVIDQEKYIGAKLPEVPVSKERWKQAEADCTPGAVRDEFPGRTGEPPAGVAPEAGE